MREACVYAQCVVHQHGDKYVHSFSEQYMHTVRSASVGWVAGAVSVCMRAQEPVQTQIGRGVVV